LNTAKLHEVVATADIVSRSLVLTDADKREAYRLLAGAVPSMDPLFPFLSMVIARYGQNRTPQGADGPHGEGPDGVVRETGGPAEDTEKPKPIPRSKWGNARAKPAVAG
jgi:hypothetical protein